MSVPATNPTSPGNAGLSQLPPTPQQSRGWLARILRNRIVQVGIAARIVLRYRSPFWLAGLCPSTSQTWPVSATVCGFGPEIPGPVYASHSRCYFRPHARRRTVDIGSGVQDKVAARRETIGVLVWPSNPEEADPFIRQHLT